MASQPTHASPQRGTETGAETGTGAALDASEFSAAVEAVTVAFGDTTRRAIYLHLRDDGPATTSAIAERFALHPNVARHHLEKLAAGGYVDVELVRPPGGAGRPSKRYAVRQSDTMLTFPPRRDDLLGTLLARALERLAPDEAAAMAEEVGFEYGKALAARIAPNPEVRSRAKRAALGVIADALTAHGFAAHTSGSGRQLAIVSEHCPFGEAAQQWPQVVCSVDRGMIRGMLEALYDGEALVTLTESRPAGSDHCVTRV